MNEQDLNNKLLDDILKYVAEKRSLEDIPKELPSDAELEEYVTFTPEFNDKMDSFFKNAKKKDRAKKMRLIALKISVAVFVFLVISTSLIFSVDAFRVPVLNFFNHSDQKSTTIEVIDEKADYKTFGDKIKGLYLPCYIPKTYTVKSLENEKPFYTITYINTKGSKVRLSNLIDGDSVDVDSENAVTENLSVNNSEAQYFEKKGISTLIFKYDHNAFMLFGPISKDECVRIAESMEYRS